MLIKTTFGLSDFEETCGQMFAVYTDTETPEFK